MLVEPLDINVEKLQNQTKDELDPHLSSSELYLKKLKKQRKCKNLTIFV